jgi:alpha-beta hydrolase superfamily lysophospholipase
MRKLLPTAENYKTVQNYHINGWIAENPQSNKIILYCHGNAGNISYYDRKIINLRDLGFNVLIFDYSGYGKSSGIPSEQQFYNDASYMVSMLSKNYNIKDIIAYGESIGGPVATYVARRYKIPILILDSPLPSMNIIAKKYLQKFGNISKFLSFPFTEFDTELYLNGYNGKTLLIHSIEDEIIPYDTIQNLIKLSTQHISTTGTHIKPKIPYEEIKRFIDTYS